MSPRREAKLKKPEPVDVTILGVHVKSTGYPNVTFRIRDLFNSPALHAQEINFPFIGSLPNGGSHPRAWKPLKWLWITIRAFFAHLYVLSAYLRRGRPRRLYIPYPSVIVLLCLSWFPRSWRPAYVIADCFISLYDTAITDRKLFSQDSWLARLLRALESRAYRVADGIIVDTELNAGYFAETFGLDSSKIMALPLSIDEAHFRPAPYRASADVCTVLFIGTFVPLQGVDVIAQAAVALESRREVRFRLIGSGQTAETVERIFRDRHPTNVEWITRWMDSEELTREIRNADICLGIFGTGPKTQRVWPLKNYAYMAVGRPIITGETLMTKQMLQKSAVPDPFATVSPGNPRELAAAIVNLARNSDLRQKYARNSRNYYEKYLDSRFALEKIISLMKQPN